MDAAISASIQAAMQILLVLSTPDLSPVWGFKKYKKKFDAALNLMHKCVKDTDKFEVIGEAVKQLLNDLRDFTCDADHILDEINYETMRHKVEIQNQTKIKRCLNIISFTPPLAFRWRMAGRNKDINERYKMFEKKAKTYCLVAAVAKDALIKPPAKETGKDNDSVIVYPYVGERQDDEVVISKLIKNTNDAGISVLPIFGMGGLGKTTLARSVINHPTTRSHFNERIWVCISKFFDAMIIFKMILEQLGGTYFADNREATVNSLQRKLEGKKYLLVLDDFWYDNRPDLKVAWDDFKDTMAGVNRDKGNVILVTTRDLKVASIVNPYSHRDPYNLKLLTNDECWSIIKARTFGDEEVPEQFEKVGKKIACKCRGLPLAAIVVCRNLQGKEVDKWISVQEIGLSKLDENKNSMMQVLKVSFDRLSSPLLKKCFAYCSIFAKDSEIDREDLIQLWMAEGFLRDDGENNMETSEEENMEALGNTRFDILLQKSFLQEAVRDKYDNIISYKMHGFVHDLAVELHEKETKEKEIRLRTLFSGSSLNEALKFKYLHILKLRGAGIEVLPSAVGKLIHLRYLDASENNGMKTLPDSICKLYSLQTLRITFLLRLPERLCDLSNLRHLNFYSPDKDFQMPPKIGNLSSLQTLLFFRVGGKEGCRIEELGFLNNLTGKLEIRNLELVNGLEEAKKADLVGKRMIYKLSFTWTTNNDENVSEGNNKDESVLEGLQPHPNLKSITIEGFRGTYFPSWTMRMEVFLDKLIEVKFKNCRNCEEIPMFGHLPLLKYLTLDGLTNIRSMGRSFYGVSSTSIYGGQNARAMFPALERLILKNMPYLAEWAEAEVMPASLRILEIENCSELSYLPSEMIESIRCLECLCVSKCDELVSFSIDLGELHCISKLYITHCRKLRSLPKGIGRLSNLRELRIGGFLESIDFNSFQAALEGIQRSKSLWYLTLYGWKDWDSLPYQLQYLTSLRQLELSGFGIEALPEWFGGMSFLSALALMNCQKLRHMPSKEAMQGLTKLESLFVGDCSLLEESCREERGPDSEWSKISHIPLIRGVG